MPIRPYSDTDLDAVLDVWFQASVVAHSFLPDDFFEQERHDLATRWLPAAETIVFEGEDAVDGFLSLVGNEVGGIFVRPDAQGRGIGRLLMDSARSRRPFLELGVLEANTAGRRFYDGYGFTVVARQIDERTGEPELRLRLGDPEAVDRAGAG